MDAAQAVERIPKTLPILSVSGDMDPFGNFAEVVKELFDLYERQGIHSASINQYRDRRHEMLRETTRLDVFKDVIRWLDARNA